MLKKSIISSPFIFRHWLSKCKDTVALDTETSDLNYLRLEIEGFSICDGVQACYVNLKGNKYKDKLLRQLEFYLNERCKLVIFHNAPFDMMVLYKYGVEI